jgi:tetratricopeptide (TPR) repeat protein
MNRQAPGYQILQEKREGYMNMAIRWFDTFGHAHLVGKTARMKFRYAAVALAALSLSLSAHAQNNAATKSAPLKASAASARTGDAGAALRRLDMANELLTYSQRAIKLYAQRILDVDVERATAQGSASVSQFSATLDRLAGEGLDKAAKDSLAEVETTWLKMIRTLSGQPSREGLLALTPPNEALIEATERLRKALATSVPDGNGDLVNLIGYQSMLVQRIARNYFEYHAGTRTNESKRRLLELLRRYETIENEIESFLGSNPKYKQDLELAHVQLVFLKSLANRLESTDRQDWLNMAKVSGRLYDLLKHVRSEIR